MTTPLTSSEKRLLVEILHALRSLSGFSALPSNKTVQALIQKKLIVRAGLQLPNLDGRHWYLFTEEGHALAKALCPLSEIIFSDNGDIS